ncbi:beta-galactosidase [Furfurilactobacillus rossiae]|uniref:Beta-galactosidase n=1 Tax=Furfurilactobacillus rossiae DSM 15814 TaxID=1114972 RepID=A0A0R1RH15_9LACO|nr:beta-galactosidase [Furfurilactobacillus rossiae]KRL54058.1 beta-galactosidase [Furfurilactobacillus rossiae DSM 15814]QLE60389.1 Beta-galactosidase [Furfurilactobacillus rossiae]
MLNHFLYGSAYYYEYLPYERLDEDIKMMKEANINVVRIGESTWSTYEPQEGKFDFSKLDKVIDAMATAHINVILGTPTYAIPTWMAKKYPEVMLTDKSGKHQYGARQLIDFTHPTFKFLAERIIRKMLKRTSQKPNVIGFQVDNETKHFSTSSNNVYIAFQKWLKNRFDSNLDQLNAEFGMDYWSNRINAWEDFPPINSTINGSLGSAFEKFQRTLVTAYLQWQVNIVNDYKRSDQFVTNNFDLEWRDQSFGLNAAVDIYKTSKVLTDTAIDIYHPTQSHLTGAEIAFGGDIARSTKDKPYIVMETEAQSFKNWVPYPGQLRLQAYSHIASGAKMVEYWHWHSIHNSFETYWKGLLSHDFKPNPVYNEAKKIGAELQSIGSNFVNSTKQNRIAIVVSNDSLTSVDWFPFRDKSEDHQYNDVLRNYYDTLYKLNTEVDILPIDSPKIFKYDLLIVPMLYSATDGQLSSLNQYVHEGGNIVYGFRSGFTNENVKVRTTVQPGIISKAIGAEYELFVDPNQNAGTNEVENLVTVSGQSELADLKNAAVHDWMELLTVTTGKILAQYNHDYWGKYAAITENKYGKGKAFYIGSFFDQKDMKIIFKYILKKTGVWSNRQEQSFPIINKRLIDSVHRNHLDFYFNYSSKPQKVIFYSSEGTSLFTHENLHNQDTFILKPWDLQIFSTSF